MTLKILAEFEKKEIENKLNEQFGIKKIPGMLLKSGEERIFFFQGSFNEKQIKDIEENIPIERVGFYFATYLNEEIRLSLEGVELLKDQIKKNTFELDEKQAEQWMMGSELNIATGKQAILVMKHKNYFLGCGKASKEKIGNFIPKSRRLKYKESF